MPGRQNYESAVSSLKFKNQARERDGDTSLHVLDACTIQSTNCINILELSCTIKEYALMQSNYVSECGQLFVSSSRSLKFQLRHA